MRLFATWFVLPAVGLSFGFLAGLLLERLAPEAAVAVFLTSRQPSQCANQPYLARRKREVTAIIALGSELWGGKDQLCMWEPWRLSNRWVPTSPITGVK